MYQNRGRAGGAGLIVALIMAVFALFRYYGTAPQVNEVTGEKQRVGTIRPDQEVALGLQAAPSLAQQYGGLARNPRGQAVVDRVGKRLVSQSGAAKNLDEYKFDFHLLADRDTVNAFALPGGQIFITEALAGRLSTEGELAGVLGHEIGHVVARHGAEHIAKQELTKGLTGAASVAVIDPGDPRTYRNAAVVAAIGSVVNMKFGRDDELESDKLGVRFMAEAGYDPRAMLSVMKILRAAGGGGGGRQPEFASTHPNPERRLERIEEAIRQTFPSGIPQGLER